MKRKTAVLLATIGLLAIITSSMALHWYFSDVVTTVSREWKVSVTPLPENSTRYENIDLNGTVKLGTTPMSGVNVTIFLAINSTDTFEIVGSNLTDANGTFKVLYNNTEPEGTTLYFKAGIEQ